MKQSRKSQIRKKAITSLLAVLGFVSTSFAKSPSFYVKSGLTSDYFVLLT